MLREMGIATITMSGLLITIFSSALLLTDEIERKNAITVLCKPVQRYQFILGKFLGISFILFIVFIILTASLMLALHLTDENPAASHSHYTGILKATLLAYFEVLLINSIALAGATRLPMLPNLAVCLTIFILGNLSEYLYQLIIRGVASDPELVAGASWSQLFADHPIIALSRILYLLIPNLSSFNIAGEVAYGVYVSPKYVILTTCYALVYSMIALLTAMVSFEHRELI